MGFYIDRSTDQKSVTLVMDIDGFDPADYPVLLLYVNNNLLTTHVVDGTATINGTSYTTTSGADDLLFVDVDGTYKFVVESETINGRVDLYLTSGVWKFVLLNDAEEPTDIIAGRVIDRDLMCCVADKWADLSMGCNKCPDAEVVMKATKVYMSAKAADFAAQQNEFENAVCMYNAAAYLCDSACGCGCS